MNRDPDQMSVVHDKHHKNNNLVTIYFRTLELSWEVQDQNDKAILVRYFS